MLLFTTFLIRPAPPLGIITSTYSFICISSSTCFLSVSVIYDITSGLMPSFFNTSAITLTMAILEFNESLPPLNMQALADLKHSPKASAVTLGLDSYIMAITPNGTVFLPIISPLGLVFIDLISPIGSSSPASTLNPSAIPSILASVRRSLSRSAVLIPFFRPLDKSASLASFM